MESHRPIVRINRNLRAAECVVGALLAALTVSALAQEGPSAYRSVADRRPRLIDEHDRPYVRETQSHRGWEIREPQFTVFADTSREDARWAAAQIAGAWQQAGKLADRWTSIHQNADFALNGLQVSITNEPPRERDAPLTTLNVVGIQTQVQINVSRGQPELARQLLALREATAFAMFHAAAVDVNVSPWVAAGLSAAAGRSGLSDDELKSLRSSEFTARFGGQQWRYARATQDTLAYPPLDHEEAASRVNFLLKGNDARQAQALFAALASSQQSPTPSNAVDQLFDGTKADYAAWEENPLAGQPLYEPTADTPAGVLELEREMVVLLKLQRRLAQEPAPTDDRGVVRPKVVTFDRTRGASIVEPTKPAATQISFASFAARLTDRAKPTWATLDVDGSVLLSTDEARLQELLGQRAAKYSFEQDAARTALVRRLDDGTKIRGWLEENSDNKLRPLAKFEVTKPTWR